MTIPPENINVDNILHGLKDFGRFQVLQYAVISLMQIPNALNLLAIVFIGYPPQNTCKNLTDLQISEYTQDDENLSLNYDSCSIGVYNNSINSSYYLKTIPCVNGFQYDEPLHTSIVTEWDLVCTKAGLGEMTQSLFIAGQGAGALLFPSLADHFGRKPIHILSLFIMMLAALTSSVAPNYWVYAPTRFFCGVCQQGCLISGVSLSCEMFPANKRTLMSGLVAVNWGLGVTLLGVVAFAMRSLSWRALCAVCALTACIGFFEIWFIKESFRWHFAKGKLEEGKKVVRFAANQNKVDFDAIWQKNVENLEELSELEKIDCQDKSDTVEEESIPRDVPETKTTLNPGAEECSKKPSKLSSVAVITVLRDSGTRKISFINIFNWLMISFTYFGIYMTSNTLAGNRFFNFFMTATMEILAGVFLLKTLTKFSRRNSIAGFQIIAGLSLISVAVLKGLEQNHDSKVIQALSVGFTLLGMLGASGAFSGVWFHLENHDSKVIQALSVGFTLLGMLGASGAFSGVWLYTPELYPTNLRSAGVGLASASSRTAGMLAPLTRLLAAQLPWAPGALFGTGCLFACALLFLLPETRDQQLPQTMEDLKILQNANKKPQVDYVNMKQTAPTS